MRNIWTWFKISWVSSECSQRKLQSFIDRRYRWIPSQINDFSTYERDTDDELMESQDEVMDQDEDLRDSDEE